jgi:hypothetical protein
MNPWVIRLGDALDGPRVATISRHVRVVLGGRIAADNLCTHADRVTHWC